MPYPTTSASGSMPSSSALARLIITSAAAPSDSCDALPAVTVPSRDERRTELGERLEGRGGAHAFVGVDDRGSPLRCGIGTGAISSANAPASIAAAARWWLANASSSWAVRLTSCSSA